MNFLLVDKVIPDYDEFTTYGELYNMNKIKYFKNERFSEAVEKYRHSNRHPGIKESEIIMFGTSSSDFSRYISFPERLSIATDKKVHFIRDSYPLFVLDKMNYKDTISKLLIYEVVERNIPVHFDRKHTAQMQWDMARWEDKSYKEELKDLVFKPNSNQLYKIILQRGFLIGDVFEFFATLGFDWFNYISSNTPHYGGNVKEEPWCFIFKQFDDVSSFDYPHSDRDVERFANNINNLRQTLKSRYNLDFLLVMVPNKVSIYHHVDPRIDFNKYNFLLQRIGNNLEMLNVPYVNLYLPFVKQSENMQVFYMTDSHWNNNGVSLATEITSSYLSNNYFTK